jgi:hypothetical protein
MLTEFCATRIEVIGKLKEFGDEHGVHLIHKDFKVFTLKPDIPRGVNQKWRGHKDKFEQSVPNRSNDAGRKLALTIQSLPRVPGGVELMFAWTESVNAMNAMSFLTDPKGAKRARELDLAMINQTGTLGCFQKDDVFAVSVDTYWLPEDKTGLEEVTYTQFEPYTKAPVRKTEAATSEETPA